MPTGVEGAYIPRGSLDPRVRKVSGVLNLHTHPQIFSNFHLVPDFPTQLSLCIKHLALYDTHIVPSVYAITSTTNG